MQVYYQKFMFLSTVLKKCFDGFCVDGAIHVDTIGTILVSNCWIFIVRIMASCAVDGRNGFSAARFSVSIFPFMIFHPIAVDILSTDTLIAVNDEFTRETERFERDNRRGRRGWVWIPGI